MNDPLLVRNLERLRDLLRNWQRVIQRNRATRNAVGERFALDKLEHERDCAGSGLSRAVLHTVDRGNVRMVQRGEDFGFTLKSRETFGIGGERLGQDLDRHVALQPHVARAINLAHTAGADGRKDLVRSETIAGRQDHARCRMSGSRSF
jgi:hypothetical protein